MSSSPKVSVLMSVFNGERYLHEAIKSILSQSLKDYELIVVNDCSTDGTSEILRSIQDERLRILENDSNLGLTKSLNRGLAQAKGIYIARQDADDLSLPDRLAFQVEYLDGHPDVAVVGSQAKLMGADGRNMKLPLWLQKAETGPGIDFQFMFDNPIFHSSVMFRRDVIWEKLHGYDESFRTSQDFELWSRVAARFPIRNLGIPLVRLRIHRDSLSSRYDRQNAESTAGVFLKNIERILGTSAELKEWPLLWTHLLNPRMELKAGDSEEVATLVRKIHETFLSLNGSSQGSDEVARIVTGKLVQAGMALAARNAPGGVACMTLALRKRFWSVVPWLPRFGVWLCGGRLFRPSSRLKGQS